MSEHAPGLPGKTFLDEAGLNRQHVFNLSALPEALREPLGLLGAERQLILFGHAGRRLWSCVQAEALRSEHPIDDYSVRIVRQWLATHLPHAHARFVFPSWQGIGLQKIGALAGWHHPAPFMVGVDARWGSWFAYRAVILTDTALPPSVPHDHGHPCLVCHGKPCIRACPAGALDTGQYAMARCHAERLAPGADCARGCHARSACPVGIEHRYEDSQIQHSAAGSLHALRTWYAREAK